MLLRYCVPVCCLMLAAQLLPAQRLTQGVLRYTCTDNTLPGAQPGDGSLEVYWDAGHIRWDFALLGGNARLQVQWDEDPGTPLTILQLGDSAYSLQQLPLEWPQVLQLERTTPKKAGKKMLAGLPCRQYMHPAENGDSLSACMCDKVVIPVRLLPKNFQDGWSGWPLEWTIARGDGRMTYSAQFLTRKVDASVFSSPSLFREVSPAEFQSLLASYLQVHNP